MAKTEFCVIGLGRFGLTIAEQLQESGKSLMVIDSSNDIIQKVGNRFDLAIRCDATDIESLREIAIKNVKQVIVATSDINSSIMICANLVELGLTNIISKAENAVHARVLKTLGIARVVIPQVEVASRIAIQCLYDVGTDISRITSELSMIRLVVKNEGLTNRPVSVLNLRRKCSLNLVFIQRQSEVVFPIDANTTLQLDDVVTCICHNKYEHRVVNLFAKNK